MKKSGMSIATLCFIGTLALSVATGGQSFGFASRGPSRDRQGKQGDVREQREVSRGVRCTHIKRTTPAGEPWSIHVLEVSRAR